MIETIITIQKLIASEGYVLTNGDVYGKEVYLGINDSVNNWYEISDTEYTDIMKKLDLLVEEVK